jgi:hypothetical protein
MTVERIPWGILINETKFFLRGRSKVDAWPFYSGTGRALDIIVYSELRYGLREQETFKPSTYTRTKQWQARQDWKIVVRIMVEGGQCPEENSDRP